MHIDFMSLFTEEIKPLITSSIIGRALQKELFSLNFFQIRDFTTDKQKRVDDAPYGGGFGMVMQADPLYNCLEHIKQTADTKPYVVLMSASGRPHTQETARRLVKKEHIVLVCGHYEGVDQRFIDLCVDEELSVGDFVLTGGEIPAMAVADSILRLIPGVLRDNLCFEDESYWNGLLEYPHYSRPEVWKECAVPEILLSGHHKNIEDWRHEQSLVRTKERRKDLYDAYMEAHPPTPPKKSKKKTEKPMFYPMKMQPCYKEMLWGGQNFKTMYKKEVPFEHTGESWEAANHKNGSSTVTGGIFDGLSLGQLTEKFGMSFIGQRVQDNQFPVLFKLIDARDRLSLQTHPDDELARADGDRGKVEMWIILSAQPGAGLYLGFDTPISKEEYQRRIEDNSLAEVLHFIPVEEGECYFLPAGMVHAIGEGLMIGEIQQNSDTTYRVYDWGRIGLDGKPRQLHIEKSLLASDRSMKGEKAVPVRIFEGETAIDYLPGCPFFAAQSIELKGTLDCATGRQSVHILFCANGSGSVTSKKSQKTATFVAGDCYVIAADDEAYSLEGDATIYRFFVPDFQQDYNAPLTKAGADADAITALWHEAK